MLRLFIISIGLVFASSTHAFQKKETCYLVALGQCVLSMAAYFNDKEYEVYPTRNTGHGTRINLISKNSNLPSRQALPRNPFTSCHLCVLFQLIQRTQCNGLPLLFRLHMG